MNRAIAWFAGNHVAANLMMLFCIIGGIMTALTMKVEVFPETSLDRISITVEYPGASPSEVEESVIRRIEEKVAGLAGVNRINSRAKEGAGTLTLEVLQGWDLRNLLDEVKSEVDRLTTLPDEAEKPVVREVTQRMQVVWVGVYGDASEATLKHLAEEMQDDITALPDVTVTELFGVRQGEIHIEITEDTLKRYNLTLGQVAQAIRTASLDLPAGSIKTKGNEILLRAKGRRYLAKEYNNIPVITDPDGRNLTLGQIAHLREGFVDSDLFARMQGKPAALVQVYRVADQNALTVAEQIKKYVEQKKLSLPEGIAIELFGDRSIVLKSRLDLLMRNLGIGLILVVLVLWAFLEWRLAFWVSLGIPISFCVGIWMLPSMDVSINMISLFAFILVLGIVVDDAIVVGENVFKKREQGMPPLQAAIKGAQEVGTPVIFAVLTTLVAFAPLLMGSGMMGKIMRNIPTVVILVLLGSLLESLLILPAHLARSRQKGAPNGRGKKEKLTSRALKRLIKGPYDRLLRLCLNWRYATLAFGVCLMLLAVGAYTGGRLKFTLFPKVESDVVQVGVNMVVGTPVERTTEVVTKLEDAAMQSIRREGQALISGQPSPIQSPRKDPESPGTFWDRVAGAWDEIRPYLPGYEEKKDTKEPLLKHTIGLVGLQLINAGPHAGGPETGSHVASIFAQLLEGEKREQTAMELATKWREAVGPLHDAESIKFKSEIFSPGEAVEVHLSTPNEADLHNVVEELKHILGTYPGVFDIADSFEPGKDELQIQLKPSGRTLGLTLSDVSTQVRHAFYGAEALRLQRDKDEVKVMVRYPENQRRSLANIERMRIRTPGGQEVPFSQVALVNIAQGYASIERAERRRVVRVTADVDENITNAREVRETLSTEVLPGLASKYPGLRFDMEGAAREQRESLADIQRGLIFALFGIYVLLAVPFRSFTQPIVVMMAIPFGVVGAVAGHLLLGYNLSILSLFGVVGLAGVVVNDSLLLVYTANRLRDEEGYSPYDAVTRAGILRFRPILLTSVTTFAGLIPIIMEKSLQAKFMIPMAISLGFGVLFATGITLLLIPCGYLILDDLQNIFRAIFRSAKKTEAQKGAKPELASHKG